MKILSAMRTGAGRTLAGWKGILLAWFVMLLLITAAVSPVKGALYNAFGDSMITEKLARGISSEAFTDLGQIYNGIIAAFSRGLVTLILINFLLNAFLTGGLFECARAGARTCSVKEFMQGCAMNFWSYILILIIAGLMIFFTALLISFVPMIFIDMESDHVEKTVFTTAVISTIIFFLLLPVHLLVADYARAWRAANSNAGIFSALGKGFSLTFGNFSSSWTMMFILILTNALFLWLTLAILPGMMPVTGTGIILLFLLSQALFIIKIALKFLRYCSVTCMMEENIMTEFSRQV